MIVIEHYKTREDGTVLNRTYSDAGFMIERDGVRYSEAVDPADLNRQYIETDVPLGPDEQTAFDITELREKAMAYDIMMGVSE